MDQAARDQEALNARRERLRALAGRIAETVEALPPPETWLEATRSARSIRLADRILTRFPDDAADTADITGDMPKARPIRDRLRASADRLMDAAESLPMPETHLEGERAARFTLAAERMLEQLYAQPVQPKPVKPAEPHVVTPMAPLDPAFASREAQNAWQAAQPQTKAERQALLCYRMDKDFRAKARATGRWMDGTRWNPDQPNYSGYCDYKRRRVEGFDPEAALHPNEKSEPWQLEAIRALLADGASP